MTHTKLSHWAPIALVGLLASSACESDDPADDGQTDASTGGQPDAVAVPDATALPDAGGGLDAITAGAPTVTIDGRRLLVNGESFRVKGVNWSPVPRGAVYPEGLDFAGYVEQDGDLMAAAGFNAIRTYEPITDRDVLDALYRRGIYVFPTVYPNGMFELSDIDDWVTPVADHPAILMWVVGNEWNYNGIYIGLSLSDSRDRLEAAAARIKTLDDRPVMTIYGGTPDPTSIAQMTSIDVWGVNVYDQLEFDGLFEAWETLSDKPLIVAEYGADAYDARQDGENALAQAFGNQQLTQAIIDEHPDDGGMTIGGFIFEFSDEWWKDPDGSPDVQDIGGIGFGAGGPYPDAVYHEEWWGLVDIDRNPRQTYFSMQSLYQDL